MKLEIASQQDLDSLGPDRKQEPASKPAERQVRQARILNVDEILAASTHETSMLIDAVIPASGASLLVGASKSGKTLLAAQMGIAAASGHPLFGRFRVCAAGAVLFVEQDDPARVSSIKAILERSVVPIRGLPFHVATEIPYQFGPALIAWLEEQITTKGLHLIVLDSYTALRSSRPKGVDIVKTEQTDLSELNALGKRCHCLLLVITHSSKGSAGLDWSEKAAGTFAMSASTESQIHISRFAEFEGAAPERLVRVRGRHSEDLELVLSFRKESLDYALVLDGGAAPLYPALSQIKAVFGNRPFSPKDLSIETGMSRATVHRHLERLLRVNAIQKKSHGDYVLVSL